MSTMAVAVIVGRLTRDAELKYTNSGTAVLHFSVATNHRRKKGNEWVEEASFWDVDYWPRNAEGITPHMTKGKLVAIEGSLRQDRWEQEGQKRSKVVITANNVTFVGTGPGRQEGEGPSQPREEVQGPPKTSANKSNQDDDFMDDIPF